MRSQAVTTFGLKCEIVVEHQSLHPKQCLCALEQFVTFAGCLQAVRTNLLELLSELIAALVQAHTLALLIKSSPGIARLAETTTVKELEHM